jgi:gliding motility-associated-like protein
LINVPDSIAVQAGFIADPPGGPEPLSVLFNNTSQNATDYEWFINNDFWDDGFNSGALFDSSGLFEVNLVAYNNLPHCADTFTVFIHVKDTLIVNFPNVFTPNNDQINDMYTLQIRGGTHINGSILNRWGNEMITINQELTPQPKTITLWNGISNGQPATEGVYFYRFIISDVDGEESTFQGYLHLSR